MYFQHSLYVDGNSLKVTPSIRLNACVLIKLWLVSSRWIIWWPLQSIISFSIHHLIHMRSNWKLFKQLWSDPGAAGYLDSVYVWTSKHVQLLTWLLSNQKQIRIGDALIVITNLIQNKFNFRWNPVSLTWSSQLQSDIQLHQIYALVAARGQYITDDVVCEKSPNHIMFRIHKSHEIRFKHTFDASLTKFHHIFHIIYLKLHLILCFHVFLGFYLLWIPTKIINEGIHMFCITFSLNS